MTLRKDGKRKLPKIHRVTDPELFAVDMAYAKRHPAESYQKLADEAGVDRLTMRERIRRVRARTMKVLPAGFDPSERRL